MVIIGIVAEGSTARHLQSLLEVRDDVAWLVQTFELHGDALSYILKGKRRGFELDLILSHEGRNKVPFKQIPQVYANQNCSVPIIHVLDNKPETETDQPYVTSDVQADELYKIINRVLAEVKPECQECSTAE